METKMTMEELVEFLNRQVDVWINEQDDIDLESEGWEYSYAKGAEEAYRFVLRTLEEWNA